jgi:hypothetical protein
MRDWPHKNILKTLLHSPHHVGGSGSGSDPFLISYIDQLSKISTFSFYSGSIARKMMRLLAPQIPAQ